MNRDYFFIVNYNIISPAKSEKSNSRSKTLYSSVQIKIEFV